MTIFSELLKIPIRFRREVDEVGWRYTLYLAWDKLILSRLIQVRKIFVIAAPIDQTSKRPPSDIAVREATKQDVRLLAELDGSTEEIPDRFDSGQRVWVIEKQGRFLACDWLLPTDKLISDWLILEKTERDVWSDFIVVNKEDRGKGLGPLLRGHVANQCRQLGFRRLLGIIDTLNRNSVRAMAKQGYGPIGCLLYIRFFGLSFVHDGSRWRYGMWSSRNPLRISVTEPRQEGSWQKAWMLITHDARRSKYKSTTSKRGLVAPN